MSQLQAWAPAENIPDGGKISNTLKVNKLSARVNNNFSALCRRFRLNLRVCMAIAEGAN